jgi:hypothetical protein
MNKYVLDPLSAAHQLTAFVLKKADQAFYRMRRTKEREYRLARPRDKVSFGNLLLGSNRK